MIRQSLKIDGMHCASCSLLIEGELEDRGITARCDWKASKVDVEYDPAKISAKDIQAGIEAAGYSIMKGSSGDL